MITGIPCNEQDKHPPYLPLGLGKWSTGVGATADASLLELREKRALTHPSSQMLPSWSLGQRACSGHKMHAPPTIL